VSTHESWDVNRHAARWTSSGLEVKTCLAEG